MYIALNASAKLTGIVGVGVTTVPVTAGKGADFAVGTNHSYVTFENGAGTTETCKITGVSGDNLTVVRTKAVSWAIGDVIECRPCAEAMADYAVAPQIVGVSAAAIADADTVGFVDASASNALAKITWANIKATIKTYFDTLYLALTGGAMTGRLDFAAGADIASAATVDLTAATGNMPRVTGTTATSAWTINAGQRVSLFAVGAWPLTYHATNNPLPGGVSYTCAAGDVVTVSKDGSSAVHVEIIKRDGTAVVLPPITDVIARDQIALTNIRLMLASAIATGALVQGKQWELATDEWGATSTSETYNAPGTLGYYNNNGGYSADQIPTMSSTTTPSGTVTRSTDVNGTLVSWKAFDKSAATYWQPTGSAGEWIAYDWGSPKTITQYTIKAASIAADRGPSAWTFEGWNGSTWVVLDTRSGIASWPQNQKNTYQFSNSTAYNKYRLNLGAYISTAHEIIEVEMMESVTPPNMTLIPPAATSVSAAPAYMDAYCLWKDDSGSAVLGTDLTIELSRDGGTTYTDCTVTNLASYDGAYSIIKGRADVSAQPSGTSMLCRIKTLNTKAQRIAAPALYAE